MNDDIYILAETLIHEEEDFLVPVRKLYALIKEEKEEFNISYEEFLHNLQEHKNFTVLDVLSEDISNDMCTPQMREYWEECGYYSGPLVYMSYDELTGVEYYDLILRKLGELIHVLDQTYMRNKMDKDFDQAKNEEILLVIDRAEKIYKKIELLKKSSEEN